MDGENLKTEYVNKKHKKKRRRKAKKNDQETSTMCKDGTQGPGGEICHNNNDVLSQSTNDEPQSTNSVALSNDDHATGPHSNHLSITTSEETSNLSSVSNEALESQMSRSSTSQDLSQEQVNTANMKRGDRNELLQVHISGVVVRRKKTYCFIKTHGDGRTIFGHRTAITEVNSKRHFDVGDILMFDVVRHAKGYRAVNILIGMPSRL